MQFWGSVARTSITKKEPCADGVHMILSKVSRASTRSSASQLQMPPYTTAGAFFSPAASRRTASGASTSNTLFVIGNVWRVPMVNAETGSQGLRVYECCITPDGCSDGVAVETQKRTFFAAPSPRRTGGRRLGISR